MSTTLVALLAALAGGFIAAVVNSLLAPRINSYFKFRSKRRHILQKTLYELLCLQANCEFHLNGKILERAKEEFCKSAVSEGFTAADVDRVFTFLRPHLPFGKDWRMSDISEKHFSDKLQAVAESTVEVHPTLAFYLTYRHGRSIIDLGVAKRTKLSDDVVSVFIQNRLDTIKRDIHLVSLLIGPFCWFSTMLVQHERAKDDDVLMRFVSEKLISKEARDNFAYLLKHLKVLEYLKTQELQEPTAAAEGPPMGGGQSLLSASEPESNQNLTPGEIP